MTTIDSIRNIYNTLSSEINTLLFEQFPRKPVSIDRSVYDIEAKKLDDESNLEEIHQRNLAMIGAIDSYHKYQVDMTHYNNIKIKTKEIVKQFKQQTKELIKTLNKRTSTEEDISVVNETVTNIYNEKIDEVKETICEMNNSRLEGQGVLKYDRYHSITFYEINTIMETLAVRKYKLTAYMNVDAFRLTEIFGSTTTNEIISTDKDLWSIYHLMKILCLYVYNNIGKQNNGYIDYSFQLLLKILYSYDVSHINYRKVKYETGTKSIYTDILASLLYSIVRRVFGDGEKKVMVNLLDNYILYEEYDMFSDKYIMDELDIFKDIDISDQ